ncbi:unnamed protein product [Periconia digitata]|uniref:Protein kinase domain-containing protein n=1 Tax=Periconia digitata TaxID=1303443 RepID=A0A9W4U4Y8_9PLEO|nr:unnamed protein product [Periconia digitata]
MVQGLKDDPDFIQSPKDFIKEATRERNLGAGADGQVSLFKHRHTGRCVAVKYIGENVSGDWREAAVNNLLNEIDRFKTLGAHPNIIKVVGWDADFDDHRAGMPALFLELATHGSMHDYQHRLRSYFSRVPELTLWKVMLDLSNGIDFLHNKHNLQLVHGDIKPGNFLVVGPPGVKEFPLLPTFKFSDFGRMEAYDPKNAVEFLGTQAYAPPLEERWAGMAPAADIWGIGATLNELAFNTPPTQTDAQFLRSYNEAKTSSETDLDTDILQNNLYVRKQVRSMRESTIRPLNASRERQIEEFNLPPSNTVEPYSNELQYWYDVCCQFEKKERATAKLLGRYLIPTAEANVEVYAASYNLDHNRLRRDIIAHNLKPGVPKMVVPPLRANPTTDRGRPEDQISLSYGTEPEEIDRFDRADDQEGYDPATSSENKLGIEDIGPYQEQPARPDVGREVAEPQWRYPLQFDGVIEPQPLSFKNNHGQPERLDVGHRVTEPQWNSRTPQEYALHLTVEEPQRLLKSQEDKRETHDRKDNQTHAPP